MVQMIQRLARGLEAVISLSDGPCFAGNICRSSILIGLSGKPGLAFLGSLPRIIIGMVPYPICTYGEHTQPAHLKLHQVAPHFPPLSPQTNM